MNPNYYLSPLVVALALALSSQVKAATPMHLNQMSFDKVKQQFQFDLPGVKKAVKPSQDSLKFVSETKDARQITHVRMQQYYEGFLVFGGYAIMHTPSSTSNLLANSKVHVTGTVYPDLQAELGQKPDLAKNANSALAQFKQQFNQSEISEEQVTPVVYVDSQHKAHWGYKVSILVQPKQGAPKRPTAILSADSFKPFIQWDNIKTRSVRVHGAGFGGNSKVGKYRYGVEAPYLDIFREAADSTCFMKNRQVIVVDMDHTSDALKRPMSFSCPLNPKDPKDVFNTGSKGDGYDEFNGAYSPSNDALYAGYVIKQMYNEWVGAPALTKSDRKTPMPLVMRVHYYIDFQNAFWDGRQMTFGDGGDEMYPLASLGIAAHEVSHGFTEQHSNLEYYGESGGMNESFSDMAAQAAEFFATGKNDWRIGAEIMKETTGIEALRFMDKPSKDGYSVDNLEQYYEALKSHPEGLDVHFASGVFNRLFYLLANQPDWNLQKAFNVMAQANMHYWGQYDGFEEGGCGVLEAAKDLGYSLDGLKKSLEEVGIDSEVC